MVVLYINTNRIKNSGSIPDAWDYDFSFWSPHKDRFLKTWNRNLFFEDQTQNLKSDLGNKLEKAWV